MLTFEKLNWLHFAVSSFVFLSYSEPLVANTYELEIYDGFDAGWSMDRGVITTNGFVGSIGGSSNIDALLTDWSIGITSPNGSFEFTPDNSSFEITGKDFDGAEFNSAIDFDNREFNLLNQRSTRWAGLALTATSGGWSIGWSGPRVKVLREVYVMAESGDVSLSDADTLSVVSLGSCDLTFCFPVPTMLIASVPEPSSWYLLYWGLVAARSRLAIRSHRRHSSAVEFTSCN